ncbi:MAG TPA: protein translocase subunit SecF [Steroidobacteraceae bacterium]|nr:protein translocase subunit SecF [Steroidobacteraceae bacterium]
MEFFRKVTKIRFMEKRKIWYAFSAVIMIGSVVLVAVRGLNFGIDFTGGIVIEAGYSGPADLERTRAALAQAGLGAAQVQSFGTAADVLVRLPPAEGKEAMSLSDRAIEAIKSVDAGAEIRRTEAIGPQVGRELTEKGATAMIMTLLFIGIYVVMRFQWKFSVGAILAALHDPFLVVGFFALTQMTFDLAVLAAILAVIGYSLNDTVVVFDRVRERLLSMRKAPPIEVMNRAINETLSRTLMTSVTTLIVVVSLLLLGGEALQGFAVALIVGVIVGTYSSIYVAGAVTLDLGLSQRDLMPPEKKEEADALP